MQDFMYNDPMGKIKQLLKEQLNKDFISATLSSPRTKEVSKIKVRPLLKGDTLFFQLESFKNNQAFHENLMPEEACEKIAEYLMCYMKQMQMNTKDFTYTILVSKKGTVTIKKIKQKDNTKKVDLSHNREKQYILKEGIPVPFLVELGVMTEEGSIIRSKFDKFRQINRFLEFIQDILPALNKEEEWNILDFGCGKSYLTFAMYYYLHELKGYPIRIVGLDLKKEVIRHCNELSQKFGYKNLAFLEGDIAGYKGMDAVDMVVTLHACDTATDFALAKAVQWNAKVILSVPCCQHELNQQIQEEVLAPLLKYGLIKERMAALMTDAIRAEYLVKEGYDAQILEFIDMEHTPKNILIRAVKTGKRGDNEGQIQQIEKAFHLTPTLGRLLSDKGDEADEKAVN